MRCDRNQHLTPLLGWAVLGLAFALAGCGTSGCPDGFVECGDLCVDLSRDRSNCGECFLSCGSGLVCDGMGQCSATCQDGLVSCDNSCIDPLTSAAFCGASGDCAGENAGVACDVGDICVGGACQPTCQPGLVACGDTCIDPMNDNSFCGASADCAGENAGVICGTGQICAGGVCALNCQAGLLACDGTCVDPQTSQGFCGASGSCTGEDAGVACPDGQVCSLGECAVDCAPGLVACDGTCIDPDTNNRYCGADDDCRGFDDGEECPSGEVCFNGRCEANCGPGLLVCDGRCVDPLTDNIFCGAEGTCLGEEAGSRCGAGRVCTGGSCERSCLPGSIACNNRCIDPLSDNVFCGASGDCLDGNAGVACDNGTLCSGGVCELSCQAGFIVCDGVCTDPLISRRYCGATGDCTGDNAGVACDAGVACGNGECGGIGCRTGQIICDGQCVDPFSNPDYCGATGDCSGANAGEVCMAGDGCYGGQCLEPGVSPDIRFAVIDLDQVGTNWQRGWWNSGGIHSSTNDNTLTGDLSGTDYNSYFIFDLVGDIEDADAVIGVNLRLEHEGYNSLDATETISVWDVDTAPTTLEANSPGGTTATDIHDDLESGVSYGTAVLSRTTQFTVVNIPLNSSAFDDLFDAIGSRFAVGVSADTAGTGQWVRFSAGFFGESRVHQLLVTYRVDP